MSASITIPSSVLEGIAARARAHPDEEICGAILRGEDIPVKNVAKHPSRRFRMDPAAQMEVWTKWKREGDLVIYHSHPSATAEPSGDDKWVITRSPDITFVIFGVGSGWFRAYRFNGFAILNVEIESGEVSTQPDQRGSVTTGPTT